MVTKRPAKTYKPGQVTARLDADRMRMLEELEKKNGANRSSILAIAITQMHERELPRK